MFGRATITLGIGPHASFTSYSVTEVCPYMVALSAAGWAWSTQPAAGAVQAGLSTAVGATSTGSHGLYRSSN